MSVRRVYRSRDGDRLARAFNEGCDARLKSQSLTSCPYQTGTALERQWKKGWWDVQFNWKGKTLPSLPLGHWGLLS